MPATRPDGSLESEPYQVICPECGKYHAPQTRCYHLVDGKEYHDTIECCGTIWDVCCNEEFRHGYIVGMNA
jgi:hypothetical protein